MKKRSEKVDPKLSRFHIRFFASVERGGPIFSMFMTLLPILINFAWVIIYFVERGNDVFRMDGVCANSNASTLSVGPTPFFITSRHINMWQLQTTFAILNAFLWAPFRFVRRGHTFISFFFLMLIEFLTVFPFLFSMVFFPAFEAYVPTYLRAFIMKREIMFILSPDGVQRRGSKTFLIVSLMLDVFAVIITALGLFEWSQNNFPIVNLNETWDVNFGGTRSYVCYSFFACFYWFVVTLSTVGYGDALPLNTVSRIVVVCFIVCFLLLLPDFLTRLSVIFKLLGDLQQKHFNKRAKGNFVVVDGFFPLPSAKQALTVLQPKFCINEFLLKNLVLMLPLNADEDEENEFTRLAVDQNGLFCELFLLRGRLVHSDDGLERSKAKYATTIYLLPKTNLQEFTWTKHLYGQQTKREAMAESREYCLKRDFDQIRRVWGLKNRLGSDMHGVKTVLFHSSNRKLIGSHSPSTTGCCNLMNILCLDSFEQRIAACTVIVPGFNTLCALLTLSGSATDKTFVEYDLEADDAMFYSSRSASTTQNTLPYTASERERFSQRQESVRHLKPSLDSAAAGLNKVSSREDAEFVLSLHNTLLLVEFMGKSPLTMRSIVSRALDHRILVLAFIRRDAMCREHFNFTPAGEASQTSVKWRFDAQVRPGDFLVCFGETSEIAQLNSAAYWNTMPRSFDNFEPSTSTSSPPQNGNIDEDGEECSPKQEVEPPPAPLSPGHEKQELQRRRSMYLTEHAKEGDFSHTFANFIQTRKSDLEQPSDVAVAMTPAFFPTTTSSGTLAPTKTTSAYELDNEIHQLADYYLLDTRSRAELAEEEHADYIATNQVGGDLGANVPVLLPARLTNHVIVHTGSHASFVYFVRKLRAAGLEETVPILLLDSKPPNMFHWSEVATFPKVYFLQGSPFILDDLVRAGFEHARCLVLLVDYRTRFQTSTFLDQENLLAEKVANRLNLMLQCNTRIVTHLVNEEHFEFIQDNELRFMDFNDEEQERLKEFAELFQAVWSPIHSESYIAGECFFPSIYIPMFFVCETRGNWISTFLDKLFDVVGTRRGLVLESEPVSHSIEYGALAAQMMAAHKGLLLGIFRNYTESAGHNLFRGVLLLPFDDLLITTKDRLYVMRGG